MRVHTRPNSYFLAIALLLQITAIAQTLSREYVRLGGRVIAIENGGVVNVVPTADSVNPSSGTGASQTFTVSASDGNGYMDVSQVYLLFHTSVSAANSCWVVWDRGANNFQLMGDNGSTWVGSIAVGSSADLKNSQCQLKGSGSSIGGSGNTRTVSFSISFASAWTGAKNSYLWAIDNAGSATGWQQRGTWTISNATPTSDSVSPSSGAGATQTFTISLGDGNGYGDISQGYLLFNTAISASGSCWVAWDRASNSFMLMNDAGTTWSAPVAVGSPSTVQNSQCRFNGSGSSIGGSGNTRTISFSITFFTSWSGTKNSYVWALDTQSASSGWQQRGTWTVQ